MVNKAIYQGLRWALTDSALSELKRLEESGVDPDLAFALLDWEVLSGTRPEWEVYNLDIYERVTGTNC